MVAVLSYTAVADEAGGDAMKRVGRCAAAVVVTAMLAAGLAIAAGTGCKGESPSGPAGMAAGAAPSTVQGGGAQGSSAQGGGALAGSRSIEAVEVQDRLWKALRKYQGSLLSGKADALKKRPDDPVELLRVVSALMSEVSGEHGLWRTTVPSYYFGCDVHKDSPLCKQFSNLDMTFLPFDTLESQISGITSAAEADAFLVKFGGKLEDYLKYYVPRSKTLNDVEDTPFFRNQLSMFIQK